MRNMLWDLQQFIAHPDFIMPDRYPIPTRLHKLAFVMEGVDITEDDDKVLTLTLSLSLTTSHSSPNIYTLTLTLTLKLNLTLTHSQPNSRLSAFCPRPRLSLLTHVERTYPSLQPSRLEASLSRSPSPKRPSTGLRQVFLKV